MDDKTRLLEIESSFLPLAEYIKALEFILNGCFENVKILPTTPIIELLKRSNIQIEEINTLMKDL